MRPAAALRGLLRRSSILRGYTSGGAAGVGHSGHLSAEAAAKRAAAEEAARGGAVTTAQRYLFDTNGYIVLKGVFSEEEVSAANAAIDAHLGECV